MRCTPVSRTLSIVAALRTRHSTRKPVYDDMSPQLTPPQCSGGLTIYSSQLQEFHS